MMDISACKNLHICSILDSSWLAVPFRVVILATMQPTKEAQKKRIMARHGDNAEGILQLLTGMYDLYELPGEGELNTYNVDITEEMSQMDVMNEVLTILEENCPEK